MGATEWATTVLCLARSVAAHATEHDSEVAERLDYFRKPPPALAAQNTTVRVPSAIDEVEHEAECAAVSGRQASTVDRDDAMDIVAR